MGFLKLQRKKIDKIDRKVMTLLDERMEVVKEIGKYKLVTSEQILNVSREKEILEKAKHYINREEIENIYKEVFIQSKDIQKYRFFLLGKTLSHSFSPLIYSMLGIKDYKLLAINAFPNLKALSFEGVNITNPYKKQAFKICDELDEFAAKTEVVNTITNIDGKLKGYNTDYYGFNYLLKYNNISLKDKKVLIIGNGDSSRTVTSVLKDYQVNKINYLVREVRGLGEYLIDDFRRFLDYEVIINTTPYGTTPELLVEQLFPLEEFENLEILIDLIYNPVKPTLLNFNKQGLKKINGLIMLVAQAAKAASIYLGRDLTGEIDNIYNKLNFQLSNIVLIGMPFAGKSKLGRKLSRMTNHQLQDIDLLMKKNNHDLKSILKDGTIEDYRALEEEYAIEVAKSRNKIIATGGGIVYSEKAMEALRKNGFVIFIDESLDNLLKRFNKSRPLIQSKEDLEELYFERIELYRKYSDFSIKPNTKAKTLLENIYEYLNN